MYFDQLISSILLELCFYFSDYQYTTVEKRFIFSKMQISKSDPKLKETYTKYDENKEFDFNSNINLEFKNGKQNEKPLVEDSKITNKRFSPLLRQVRF